MKVSTNHPPLGLQVPTITSMNSSYLSIKFCLQSCILDITVVYYTSAFCNVIQLLSVGLNKLTVEFHPLGNCR